MESADPVVGRDVLIAEKRQDFLNGVPEQISLQTHREAWDVACGPVAGDAMLEPDDAKELIEEAIEEAEKVDRAERVVEKRFRDRVSILVGLFAVLLAIIHVAAAGNARDGVLKTIEASDTYNYMQAKIIREAILKTAAQQSSLSPAAKKGMLEEAARLRNPDQAGHGISQLQPQADRLRDEGQLASKKGEWYEFAETAMQVAIVLLSIALVARSWAIVTGAASLAGVGVLLAAAAASGLLA
jgi:uncharacterized protein DUF4337